MKNKKNTTVSILKYEDYLGIATYDDEAKIFHGEVIKLKDVITFQAKNKEDLQQAFQDSINDYLAWSTKQD